MTATAMAVGLIGVGFASFVTPKLLADVFGVPIGGSGRVFPRGIGSRDAALGLLILTPIGDCDRRSLRATLLATALAGASDLVVGAAERGPIRNLVVHAAGASAFFALGLWKLDDGSGA